ncbi:hypothetical protein BH11ACT6_BH11ACT6_15500 [soil metagenome]
MPSSAGRTTITTMSIPALSLLLGPDAAGLLDAAVGEYGASLTSVQVADAHVAPTGGVRVRYCGQVRRADGSLRAEVLVAATGDRITSGAAVLAGEFDGAAVQVGVWRWQQDPALPGLATASHPVRLAQLLAGGGIRVAGPLRISVRAYRPGQRAVLEVSDSCSRWFVKVVPPVAVAGLQRRHALLSAVLPVPPIVAADADGLIVLAEAPGTLLRHLVSRDAPYGTALPNPKALQQLLDRLPSSLSQLPARVSHLQRVEQSVRVLQLTAGASALLEQVADELRSAPRQQHLEVPVHGDFHDGQLLFDGGRISSVIDIDTAGRGERADEWAALLGHLSVYGLSSPRARSYGAEVLAFASRQVDADDLRLRTAAVVLGLATGPFRTQRPDWRDRTSMRLALAHQWLLEMRINSSAAPAALMSTRDC